MLQHLTRRRCVAPLPDVVPAAGRHEPVDRRRAGSRQASDGGRAFGKPDRCLGEGVEVRRPRPCRAGAGCEAAQAGSAAPPGPRHRAFAGNGERHTAGIRSSARACPRRTASRSLASSASWSRGPSQTSWYWMTFDQSTPPATIVPRTTPSTARRLARSAPRPRSAAKGIAGEAVAMALPAIQGGAPAWRRSRSPRRRRRRATSPMPVDAAPTRRWPRRRGPTNISPGWREPTRVGRGNRL